MHELARVTLQNEMDLILAHKRSMKLAELAGLSLSAQTTFATAVSEVSRNTIDGGNSGCLILSVVSDERDKYIVACLKDEQANTSKFKEGLEYAKRLVNKYQVVANGSEASVELFYYIAPPFKIDKYKVDEWRGLFRNEPALSPYDELKRKNEQLQDLSEKVQKSEAQYKTLTNSLPLIIFSMNGSGEMLYANEWLIKYSGETVDSLNASRWRSVIHEDDYNAFSVLLNANAIRGTAVIKTQARLKNTSGEYLWHQVSLSAFDNNKEGFQYWIGYIVDIHTQKVLEQTLQDNIELKETQKQLTENQLTLEKYIEELNRSNQELQQFAFIASHDLQEPVRKLLYYSDYLLSNNNNALDEKGIGYLENMQQASQRMRSLIQDLLVFSQVTKEALQFNQVDLNEIVNNMKQDFEMAIEEKSATISAQPLPVIYGDRRMMQQLFENIIGNSLKYSRKGTASVIEISCREVGDNFEFAFSDNGIGFDEKHLPQMFTLFQRLHTREVYEGTGLGLAICRKIVEMHNGSIWARSNEGQGATFYVSLPGEHTVANS